MSAPKFLKKLKSQLPPIPDKDWRKEIRSLIAEKNYSIIVLDDDPTGTQTVHDVPVLTEWSEAVIREELQRGTPLFFILTNSRSLTPNKAEELAKIIGKNIKNASSGTNRTPLIISRSDSTLRGHYPVEVEGLLEGLENKKATRILIPAFFEGGRITQDDVHYVAEKDRLIPAAETPYAKDIVFGYKNSNLKAYVEEKTNGKVKSADVISFSIQELRTQNPKELAAKLSSLPNDSTCIVNAVDPYDLQVFALALLHANGIFICRTAASFVPAIAALPAKPLIQPKELLMPEGKGKLILVGSHVPKSSQQLANLLTVPKIASIKLDLTKLLPHSAHSDACASIIDEINGLLQADKTLVVYTQRKLIEAHDDASNLSISEQVSALLCHLVSNVKQSPKFILAKGGITSSDIATKSLRIKRARVAGQILPGVPVWEAGSESKFPGISYIVFPGNVGEEDSISNIVRSITL